MSTNVTRPQKDTDCIDRETQRIRAQEEFHDAFYIGTDAAGVDHWWSPYHFASVQFDADGDMATVRLPESITLSDHVDNVAELNDGWIEGPHVGKLTDGLEIEA